jgi:hypothetical protein
MTLAILILVLLVSPLATAAARRELNFPDILGYKTLKCDLHMHTVFSDGLVWPTVRVDEAWREGLDVISITDHIEYQPHKEDIPTNHNRPYEIALSRAKERDILLIRGAEITRETPPGHFNAIFLEDIDPLDTDDFIDVIKAANGQNAFVFWNHPGWKPKARGWSAIHTKLYENKWLHGIEVANGDTYYPEAHQWCLEKNLTMLGTSDIHGPATDREIEITPRQHRTMTLVFAKGKTIEGVKDALVAGRTAVWYQNQLIGGKKYLDAMFRAVVQVAEPSRRQGRAVWFAITNDGELDIRMRRSGSVGPATLCLPAKTTKTVPAKISRGEQTTKLSYIVDNLLIGPEEGLPVTLTVRLPPP